MLKEYSVKTGKREELVDITGLVKEAVSESGVDNGIALVFVPHTTAAVTINENADPSVKRDIIHKLNKEIPQDEGYHHSEGNSDAHIKSSLFGPSLQVIVSGGKPLLGTWQGILFCEFDGPRSRKVRIKVISG